MPATPASTPGAPFADSDAQDGSTLLIQKRRGCLGPMVTGGFGCGAFMIGAALAIALAAPQLLSGWGAKLLERWVEQHIEGEVEIFDLELHWRQSQRARRVVIRAAPDDNGKSGENVAEFSLRFPSLEDLMYDSAAEWAFVISDAVFTAHVDEDGTSDLGRCLGIDAADGRTEIAYFLSKLVEEFPQQHDAAQRSVRMVMRLHKARFIDMGSDPGGRTEATLSDATLVLRSSRVELKVELEEATIGFQGASEAAASFELAFAADGGAAPILKTARLNAQPVPLDTLRLLGLLPRVTPEGDLGELGDGARGGPLGRGPGPGSRVDGFAIRDAYGPMGAGLLRGTEAFFAGGAEVALSYGEGPAQADHVAPSEPYPSLRLHLANSIGEFDVIAVHRDGMLVGESAPGEDDAIDGRFELAPGVLANFMVQLLPPGAVEVNEERDGAQWLLRSRGFHLPLPGTSLTSTNLFGDRTRAVDPGAPAGGPNGARSPRWRRMISDALRMADARLDLSSAGSARAALSFVPAGSTETTAFDRLDWVHWVTSIHFSGQMGASIESRWEVAQSARQIARVMLAIPGAALAPGEDLSPRLSLQVPEVPTTLLQAVAPLPLDLAGMLPRRFDYLGLSGLRAPQLVAGPVRIGAAAPGSQHPVLVKALLDGSDRVEGSYYEGRMSIPYSSVSVPLDPLFCDQVLRAYMPWFASVRPGGKAGGARSLGIEMRDFTFAIGSDEFEQTGEVVLRPGPLRVKLHPDIARELAPSEAIRAGLDAGATAEDGDDGNWIAWTPPPLKLSFDGLWVHYDGIELPLSDDHVRTMEGRFDRKDGVYFLSGLVESALIAGLEGGDALRMVTLNRSGSGDAVTVAFTRGTIDPEPLTTFVKQATELGESGASQK